jgi:hypothetical protein
MVDYRPNDPRVISAMINLSLRNGDAATAKGWQEKLAENDTSVVTLETILEKQRVLNKTHKSDISPDTAETPRKRRIRSFLGKFTKP